MESAKSKRGGAREGAGRKSRAQTLHIDALLDSAWPRARRIRAIKRLADMAESEEGDTRAAALLLGYAYGKPAQPIEIDLDDRIANLMALVVAGSEDETAAHAGGGGPREGEAGGGDAASAVDHP
jgi:hypothetical protein